ncbi:hypothetical protein C8R43DRAFT_943614 [Mycena crocata]|nr:hypothetical protein C8R43DRAFT_943609 [Mycena crocata]KAJ7173980.1 hypothetical protein C8R43DRAFT_943614 [Mycena crocata]
MVPWSVGQRKERNWWFKFTTALRARRGRRRRRRRREQGSGRGLGMAGWRRERLSEANDPLLAVGVERNVGDDDGDVLSVGTGRRRESGGAAMSEVVGEVVGVEEERVEVQLSAQEVVGAQERPLVEVGGSGVLGKVGWSDAQLYSDACRWPCLVGFNKLHGTRLLTSEKVYKERTISHLGFFPPPHPPSAETQPGGHTAMLKSLSLPTATPLPSSLSVSAVAVVVAVTADVEAIDHRRQLTMGVAAHDLGSTSWSTSLPPTSLTQPLSDTGLRHILGLAEIVWMQRRWFCMSEWPQEGMVGMSA